MTGVNYMAALGRIMMAAIFLVSGFLHVLHLSSPADVRAPIAVVTNPEWAFYIATGIELVGGTFLALGLGTRYVARCWRSSCLRCQSAPISANSITS